MTKIKVVDLPTLADPSSTKRQRKVLMNGPRFHTWINIYTPGDIDEMHCHNADQTFYLVEGECTMHFPDAPDEVLHPGQIALMPGGQFYQLHNTSNAKMILLGSRALNSEQSLKIDYETREPIGPKAGLSATPPQGTSLLV